MKNRTQRQLNISRETTPYPEFGILPYVKKIIFIPINIKSYIKLKIKNQI